MQDIDQLKRLRIFRGQYKATITRIDNFVNDPITFASASVDILEARKEKLISTLKDYEKVQMDILSLDDKDNEESTKDEPAVCSSCNAVISGRIVTALNKKWHPEHFQCQTCRKPIDGAKFHQHDGAVHCVPCFAEHHSPRCHGCGDPITDRVIQALGVSWHANHFVCGGCKKELGGGGFMEQAGRPYCSGCYADKFAARCAGCSKPITDKAIIALDAKWHRECFTCNNCRNPVTDSTFSVMDNKPLCGKCA